jgi:hypothetical protein
MMRVNRVHRSHLLGVRWLSSDPPKLVKAPAYPLIGSTHLLGANFPKEVYKTWPKLQASYGDFYSLNLPGPLMGEVHVINDPEEFLKVTRNGKFLTVLQQCRLIFTYR